MKKVLVVMGSDSDLKVMEKCVDRLKSFDIPTEVRICSAHRTPAAAEQLAKNAAAEGFGVIIAAAGKAAHLGGVLAGLHHASGNRRADGHQRHGRHGQPALHRADAQGHSGGNRCDRRRRQRRAILAAQMIALSDDALAAKLAQFKADMAAEVTAKDEKVRAQFA